MERPGSLFPRGCLRSSCSRSLRFRGPGGVQEPGSAAHPTGRVAGRAVRVRRAGLWEPELSAVPTQLPYHRHKGGGLRVPTCYSPDDPNAGRPCARAFAQGWGPAADHSEERRKSELKANKSTQESSVGSGRRTLAYIFFVPHKQYNQSFIYWF